MEDSQMLDFGSSEDQEDKSDSSSTNLEDFDKELTTKQNSRRRTLPKLIKKNIEVTLDKNNNVVGYTLVHDKTIEDSVIIEETHGDEIDGDSDEIPDELNESRNGVQEFIMADNYSEGVPDEISEKDGQKPQEINRAKKYSISINNQITK